MDYRPRYQQPFTLEEARQLAVPLITEGASSSRDPHLCGPSSMIRCSRVFLPIEIARLQNSLTHLQRTQRDLEDALVEAPGDADLTEAFEENEIVMCAFLCSSTTVWQAC